jgi:hypothetical protein
MNDCFKMCNGCKVHAMLHHWRVIISITFFGDICTKHNHNNNISSKNSNTLPACDISSATTISNFTSGAAGDWGPTSDAMATANYINNRGVG